MGKLRLTYTLLLAIIICITSAGIHSQAAAASQTVTLQSSGYIIKVRDNAPALRSLSNNYIKEIGKGYFKVKNLEDAEGFLDKSYIEYIEPNYYLTLSGYPDDTYYTDKQWNLNYVNIAAAWDAGLDGSGVKVAVIDSGLVAGHEDIDYYKIHTGINYTDVGDVNDITDQTGHGSFITGVIAAQMNNATGIAGMMEGVSVLPLKSFSSKTTTLDMVLTAINEAVTRKCDVINMSFGMLNYSQALEDALNAAAAEGIILIAAAGNSGTSALNYPAAFDSVIGVGSVNSEELVSSFSQRNDSVFVTAPGEDITSLWYTSGTSYYTGSGTSFSAPCVTALAAMAKQYDSDIDNTAFEKLLIDSAVDKGNPGYDTSYGYGIVNAASLVTELNKAYTISYELNEGAFPQDITAPLEFSVTSELITLPEPVRQGFTFAGWYDNAELVGMPFTGIPAGTAGDILFYAKWHDNSETNVTGTSVAGYAGVLTGTDTYKVVLPAGTLLTDITPDMVIAVPEKEITGIGIPETTDGGVTWKIVVTGSSPDNFRIYTINVEVSTNNSPEASTDALNQTGTAAPPSLDGLTAVVVYNTEIAPEGNEWFSDADGDALTYNIYSSTAKGEALIEGSVLKYTPAAEDAGSEAVFVIKANDGQFDSKSGVTVTVSVTGQPASSSVISPQTAVYDKYGDSSDHKDILIIMNLFGNTLTEIRNSEYTLTADDYILAEDAITVGGVIACETSITIKKEYLNTLEDGEVTLDFYFSGGDPSIRHLTVTICDSDPFIPVTGITGIPTTATVGTALSLTGTVAPAAATNKAIVWSIKSSGGTGAAIQGNVLTAASSGSVVMTATILKGAVGGNYSKDFTITVNAATSSDTGTGGGGWVSPPAVVTAASGDFIRVGSGSNIVQVPYTQLGNDVMLIMNKFAVDELLGKIENTDIIMVDISSFKDAGKVTISTDAFKALAGVVTDNGYKGGLTIKLPEEEIAFGSDALVSIARQATGKSITFSIEMLADSVLSSEQKTIANGAPIYNLAIQSGETRVTEFTGMVNISLQYTNPGDWEPAGIVVWCMYKDNKNTEVPATYNKLTGTLSFNADHFSYYVVAYDTLRVWKNPFIDVTPDAWYFNAIRFVNCNGLFLGTDSDSFSPNLTVNRAMFVTVLGRLARAYVDNNADTGFADVINDGWSVGYIKWAAGNGIVSGYGRGIFGQYDEITREQMAIILFNYARFMKKDISNTDTSKLFAFTDGRDTHSWAVSAMAWAVNNGLVSGNESGLCSPYSALTRAQMATILQRFQENVK